MIIRTNLILFLFLICIQKILAARSESRRGFVNNIRIQPTIGEPWPKPQSIQSTTQRFAIHPSAFRFRVNETSQTCDLLTGAFDRYYRAIFYPSSYLSYILRSPFPLAKNVTLRKNLADLGDLPLLEDLNVFIQQPCDKWPNLESNESCKHRRYSFSLKSYLFSFKIH